MRRMATSLILLLILTSLPPHLVGGSTTQDQYCSGNIVISIDELTTKYPDHKLNESKTLTLISLAPNKNRILNTPPQLPQRIFNTVYLPPVKSQGPQNSCVGWASTYYLWTYMQAWTRDIEHPSSTWAFSPAFTYNLINPGENAGSYFTDAMNVLTTLGAPHWPTMPYDSSDYTTWPSSKAFEKALNYRAENWYWLYIGNESGITQAKSLLAAGYVLLYGINVWENFYNIDDYNNIYSVHSKEGNYKGGHAVVIIGYDDTLQTPDGPGAFRLVNSWGTYWGDNGYFWMTYKAVQNSNLSQMWAIVISPRKNYKPKILTYVKISHNHRGEIIGHGGIELGTGNPNTPQWKNNFLDFYIGRYRDLNDYQTHPFPDDYLVFDLTDSLNHIPPNTTQLPIYISIQDKLPNNNTGTLTEFKILINTTHLHIQKYAPIHNTTIPEGQKLTITITIPLANYDNTTPPDRASLNQSWITIGVGSLINITKAILILNNTTNLTMKLQDPTYAYYNTTALPSGNYTYHVHLTLSNGNQIDLPTRHVEITQGRMPADINGDGRISVTDALIYLRFSLGFRNIPYIIDPEFDDMTGDAKITLEDALAVLRMAVGII